MSQKPKAQSAPPTPTEPTVVSFRNDSPQGALQLPLLGRDVAHGEVIDVPEAQAHLLRGQDIWVEVPAGTPKTSDTPEANNDTTTAGDGTSTEE